MASSQQEVLISLGNYSTEDWSPLPRSPLMDAVNTIIACLALLGNGMVITVLLVRRRVFSSFTNRLILHQSVIDLIGGVVIIVQQVVTDPNISISMEGNFRDQFICHFVESDFVFWYMTVVSLHNLVVISRERFMAICHPVKHRHAWTVAKLKFIVVTVWGISVVYTAPLLFLTEARQGRCQTTEMTFELRVFVGCVASSLNYFLPIGIMTYAYVRILIVLNKKLKNPVDGRPNALCKAKKNVLATTLLTGVVYVVCWTPVQVLAVHTLLMNTDGLRGTLYIAFAGLASCSMFVNPIIYCFMYKHFRSQLKDLVLQRFRSNRVHCENPQ